MSSPVTNALTYNSYITQIATLAVVNYQTVGGIVQGVDAAFNAIIPQMLSYAELRIQRDLDLLGSKYTNTSYSLTAGNNKLALSVNDFITVQTVSYISGTQNKAMTPVSTEFITNVYNDSSITAPPDYYCMQGGDNASGGNTSLNLLVGPYPDMNYAMLITGTAWLPSLFANAANSGNASTNTTWISTNMPDLLLMASMIYISGFQRNWGRQADDPAMGLSYEGQYQSLLKSAQTLESRKKFQASAWTSQAPAVAATPTR